MTTYLLAGIFLVALFYSSVGHGGASGYLALMALSGACPENMRFEALLLNIFVAGAAFILFYRSGNFSVRTLALFAITSVPAAYISSRWMVNPHLYKIILGFCLVIAVVRILYRPPESSEPLRTVPVSLALVLGFLLGILSGMIGIGGGIILSPLLILFRWSSVKQAAGISAMFILLNSIAGIAGMHNQGITPDSNSMILVIVALTGGMTGSYLGSQRIPSVKLRYILSGILCLAAMKLLIL